MQSRKQLTARKRHLYTTFDPLPQARHTAAQLIRTSQTVCHLHPARNRSTQFGPPCLTSLFAFTRVNSVDLVRTAHYSHAAPRLLVDTQWKLIALPSHPFNNSPTSPSIGPIHKTLACIVLVFWKQIKPSSAAICLRYAYHNLSTTPSLLLLNSLPVHL